MVKVFIVCGTALTRLCGNCSGHTEIQEVSDSKDKVTVAYFYSCSSVGLFACFLFLLLSSLDICVYVSP